MMNVNSQWSIVNRFLLTLAFVSVAATREYSHFTIYY
jgi:hypothetical protein